MFGKKKEKKCECKQCEAYKQEINTMQRVMKDERHSNEKYIRWLSEEYRKRKKELETELKVLRESVNVLVKDPVKFQKAKRRSGKELTLECVILTLKDMQKELLHFDSLALSHEEYRKKHGEETARMWADVGYDALSYAIEKLQI